MGKYIEGDFPEAESMFERLIGSYSFAVTSHIEVHKFGKKTGHQIKLKEMPLEIEQCEGYLKFVELQFEGWVQIPIKIICQMGQVLDIPPSVFQVPYEQVRVTYKAGAEEIPEEIYLAVREIADLLENENVSEWNLPLSHNTLVVIGKYKK